MEPKIVSFDLDGTLVKLDLIDRFWFEEVPKLYARYHDMKLDDAVDFVRKSYGEVGPEEIGWYLPQYWFDEFGFEEDPMQVLESVSHEVEVFQDAWDVLEELQGDYELIVVSNASREFLNVQLEEIERYFSRTYSCVSDLERVKKDVEVYREVCEEVGIDPKDMVHVGDDQEFDYNVPRHIGIRSFLIDRDGDCSDNGGVLRNLRELLDKI